MFFVGLLGLPWLWIVNILYFFDRVYGRLPCFGDAAAGTNNDNSESNAGILGLMSSGDEDEETNGTSKMLFQLLLIKPRT